jgi:DNA-binding transcriptional MerR regulator
MTGRRPPVQAGGRDADPKRPAPPPSTRASASTPATAGRWGRGAQPAAEQGYRGPIVSKLVDISYRQLDYWARTGLVTPSVRAAEGSGSQRLYSFSDLVELRIIKRLLDAGVSLQRIRQVIDYLRKEFKGRFTDVTLMCDGSKRVYVCHSPDEIVDVFAKGQGVFGIAVGAVWADTEGDIAHLPDGDRHAQAPRAEPPRRDAAETPKARQSAEGRA